MGTTEPMTRPPRLPERFRADLTRAMKAGDRVRVRVLRTALAAIANAEAPPQSSAPRDVLGRLADVPRLVLTDADLERIVRDEIADREDTINRFTQGGRLTEAAVLQDEVAILDAYLGPRRGAI